MDEVPLGQAGDLRVDAPDPEHVLVAGGGDQPDPGAVPVDQGVRRLRGAVHEQLRVGQQFRPGQAELPRVECDRLDDAFVQGTVAGEGLGHGPLALLVDHYAVGEGTADVNGDAKWHAGLRSE